MSDDTLDGTPVTTNPAEHTRLLAEWERVMDVVEFQDVVAAAGHRPPDSRPGWMAVRETGPNGEDVGLVWAEPDEADEAGPLPGFATLPDGSHVSIHDLPGT